MIESKLFFLHIPKIAGTSLRSYLIDQYHAADVFQKRDWSSLNTSDLDEIGKYSLIMGHFDYRMIKLLPAGYKTATFLREPIARTVSAIQHAMRDSNFRPAQLDIEGKTFKEIIRDPEVMKWFANTQVSLLGADCPQDVIIESYALRKAIGAPLFFMEDNIFDLNLAIKHLKKFSFVGIMEEFDQGLLHLADLLGFYPPKTAPLLNKMLKDESFRLDDEDVTILQEYNDLDIKLYNQAVEINSSQIPFHRDASLRKYFSLRSPIDADIQLKLSPPFSGWGFYESEEANGITYRWSGPHNSSGVSIKLAHGRCKLKFKYYLDSKKFAQNVDIFIGDQQPEAKVWTDMGYHYCEFVLDIADSNGEMIDFNFKTDKTLSPSTFCDQDSRSLGFMLIGVDIRYEKNLTIETHEKQQDLVKNLYKGFFHREPLPTDLKHWVSKLTTELSVNEMVYLFLKTDEFASVHKKVTSLFVPPGHFYSPIVNVDEITEQFFKKQIATSPLAIRISQDDHIKLWNEFLSYLKEIPFPEEKSSSYRYYFNNPAFSYGDGSILYAMILRFKPNRLVEVGSGFSSVCVIDTIDSHLNGNVDVSFVEPYPNLLVNLLGEETAKRFKIHACAVQKVDITIFESLESGDFLFIDSTHVMKTGSDVNYELFDILPTLKSGVFVHFHDIFWPFEYSENWVIKQNRSWNEIYGLRAFLMYNEDFEIVFMNDYFAKHCRGVIEKDFPLMLKNTGGSIWLRKVKIIGKK
jgi:hypothetical protein